MSVGVAATSTDGEARADGTREGAFGGATLLGELLVAAGRQDEAAFARFYRLTSPWIYYLLRRRSGSDANAEAALSLAYVTIWRRSASFDPAKCSALAWATTIATEPLAS